MKTTDNTILITGGTSGIGLAFAEKFLTLGNKVIICGRRTERLNEIKGKYPEIITRACDLSILEHRENLASWVISNYPGLNILINNAGIQLLTDMTHPMDLERVRSEVEINFIAPLHLSSLFFEHLSKMNRAAIINISSGLAFTPIASVAVYCATKAALHSLTMSTRYQLKGKNIEVFEIAPPSVDTELGHDRRADKNQTHGGMAIEEFIEEALLALENNNYESAIGMAKNMYEKREALFTVLNP